MKFISKFSNYRVVLRPGTPGNRAIGTQPIPGLYIKFEGGIVEVNNEEHIEMLKKHPSFGEDRDFIAAPDDGNDPYVDERKNLEPAHNITEVKYGQAGNSMGDKPKVKLSPIQKKAIREMASDLVAELLPKAVEAEIAKRNADKREDAQVVNEIPVEDRVPTTGGDINVTTNIVNDKVTAPEPIEDDTPVEEEGEKELNIVKEEAKVGGVETGDTVVEEKPEETKKPTTRKPAARKPAANKSNNSGAKEKDNKTTAK